jgi:hypothetical protein
MVKLRKRESGDLEGVHALVSRMDVVRHMLLPLCSREESEEFLRSSNPRVSVGSLEIHRTSGVRLREWRSRRALRRSDPAGRRRG